MVSLRAVAWT